MGLRDTTVVATFIQLCLSPNEPLFSSARGCGHATPHRTAPHETIQNHIILYHANPHHHDTVPYHTYPIYVYCMSTICVYPMCICHIYHTYPKKKHRRLLGPAPCGPSRCTAARPPLRPMRNSLNLRCVKEKGERQRALPSLVSDYGGSPP